MFEVYNSTGGLDLSFTDSTMRLLAVQRVNLAEGATGSLTLPSWGSGDVTVVFIRDYPAEDNQPAEWSRAGFVLTYWVPYAEVVGYLYVFAT